LWRHMYDKWRVQEKFAKIVFTRTGDSAPLVVAHGELDVLLRVRERLLSERPERQDISFRERKVTRLVWRYLLRREELKEAEAKFKTGEVSAEMGFENEMTWDDVKWDRLMGYLTEQARKGRIFIDPRNFYDHYSWLIEDSLSPPPTSFLPQFYDTFAQELPSPPASPLPVILDCAKCSQTTHQEEEDDLPCCLLCLPRVDDVYTVMSPSSSLLSPPRTPGTTPLPSYFRGRRLAHPRPEPSTDVSDEDVAGMLITLGKHPLPERAKKRQRRELHLF